MGANPTTAALLLALLALVVAKHFAITLAMPSAADRSVKEGSSMKKKRKLMFTSVLETIHGLGVSGWVSYLLSKVTYAHCFGNHNP